MAISFVYINPFQNVFNKSLNLTWSVLPEAEAKGN